MELPADEFGDMILPCFREDASRLHQVGFELSIVCLSTPAAPPLDLTALYASYTRRLSILNGLFVVSVDVILSPVVPINTTA